jgi:hypothetical protein
MSLAPLAEITLHGAATDRLLKQFLDSGVNIPHPKLGASVLHDLNYRIADSAELPPAIGRHTHRGSS